MLLFFISGSAMAGGGTWKIGPFGPYWDDNSWPEFTPMYWMEEFLNQLDDDDAEIQQWMMRNQYQGAQVPQRPYFSGEQGAYSAAPQNNPATQPYNSMQLNVWTAPDQWDVPVSAPEPGASPANQATVDSGREAMNRVRLGARQPRVVPQQRGYPPVQDYSPQAYQRPTRQRNSSSSATPRSAYPEFESLPNLTPQEFSRMPPQLQQQYEHAFNQAFAKHEQRRQIEQVLRNRPPVYARPGRDGRP